VVFNEQVSNANQDLRTAIFYLNLRDKISLIRATGASPQPKVLYIYPGAQNNTSDSVSLSQLACAEDGWEREMVLALFPPLVICCSSTWRERPGRDLINKQQHIEVLAPSCSELLGITHV